MVSQLPRSGSELEINDRPGWFAIKQVQSYSFILSFHTCEVSTPRLFVYTTTATMTAEGIASEGVQATSVDNVKDVVEPLLKEPQADPASTQHKYHLPEIPLVDRYVDEPRKLRVTVVGAGLSGVIAGVLLPAKVPNIELTILEKNADVVSISGRLIILPLTNSGRNVV